MCDLGKCLSTKWRNDLAIFVWTFSLYGGVEPNDVSWSVPESAICPVIIPRISQTLAPGGGGGVLPYVRYMGMCRCEWYGFLAV